MNQAKQLSPAMNKMYAYAVKRHEAQVGRKITAGELKAIRARYEQTSDLIIAGDDWTVANV